MLNIILSIFLIGAFIVLVWENKQNQKNRLKIKHLSDFATEQIELLYSFISIMQQEYVVIKKIVDDSEKQQQKITTTSQYLLEEKEQQLIENQKKLEEYKTLYKVYNPFGE